ncbi:MAG: copper-translocating P-type ATPase [Clostridia bacterium]|nr:copper-translocating P-type ATPase [Clostridia bacterium]
MKKIILSIEGMTCSACSNSLEKYLNKQDGINNATVNLVMNNASIEYDEKILKLADLDRFVKEAGFKSLGQDNLEFEEKENKKQKFKLVITGVLSLLIMFLSMSHSNYSLYLMILTSIVLILGSHILISGIKNLLHRSPNMDTLVTLGVVASYWYSLYGTYMILKGNINYVESLYYDSASMVLFFIQIGKYIENKSIKKTKEALKSLVTITPKSATIIRQGAEWKVTLDEIQKGDIVICKPGEKIAVDGTIIDGTTHIDESFITGESIPVKREVGSKVIAGSINFEGAIKYRAEKIGKESTVSEIVKLVVEATNTKAPIAKIADKVSSFFVPIVSVLAVVSFIVWYFITKDFNTAINRFVSVLVIACPCSLGLATPLAIVIASGLCSKKGILVKSSEALEYAHKVKTVVFDKTGTLTTGTLTISKIYNYCDETEENIIAQVASIEKNSEHPIGKAIVNYAEQYDIELKKVQDFKAISGMGVYAKIDANEYYIGNKDLMNENFVDVNNMSDEIELVEKGNSILYVSKNKKLISLIGVKDVVRNNIKDVIKNLMKKNIEVIMLTGDNKKTAESIAKEIGIENVISNVKPNEKAEKISRIKQNGLTMMCGDGINDSISLVASDIGVSISNGTDVAIDSADVVLINDNLDRINDLINISNKTIKNIKQNLFWAFFYNICMIPIAMGLLSKFGIILNPMLAAIAMTLSSLAVVLNSLRLIKI